jgi:hypothetical protein
VRIIRRPSGTAYLLHFHAPYRHARHYLGWIPGDDLGPRLFQHRIGDPAGSPLMAAVHTAGIDWDLARTWPATSEERAQRLRHTRKSAELCPICTPPKRAARRRSSSSARRGQDGMPRPTSVDHQVATAMLASPPAATSRAIDCATSVD